LNNMRFSTLALTAFVNVLLTPVFASQADIPIVEQDTTEVSSMQIHNFPAVWNFEVEKDFTETPEIMAQIEHAFILAANEVHDSTDIKFISAFVKDVMHEHFTKDNLMMLGEEDVENEEDDDDDDNAPDGDETSGSYLRPPTLSRINVHFRSRNTRNSPLWRPNYKTVLSVACNLCARNINDDATTAMLGSPMELGNQFYELGEGRSIHLAWQNRFCQKLRNIKALQKPRRCFIYFDLDHEDPVDGPNSAFVSQA